MFSVQFPIRSEISVLNSLQVIFHPFQNINKIMGNQNQASFGPCTAGLQYFRQEGLFINNFVAGEEFCNIHDGTLAIPFSSERVDQLEPFFRNLSTLDVWTGLVDSGLGMDINGQRFRSLNGKINPFTHTSAKGEGLWRNGEPNEQNSCVSLNAKDKRLQDVNCSEFEIHMCQRFCESPTFTAFSECHNDTQLYMNGNDVVRSFDEAHVHCESYDMKGNLAIPTDDEKLTRILDFFNKNKGTNAALLTDAYLGLRDFHNVNIANDTARFVSVMTGTAEAFTSSTAGQYPWQQMQPNGSGGCVIMVGQNGLLKDTSCGENTLYVCERPCVSSSPTTSPTSRPTTTPTQNPTSASPTASPTQNLTSTSPTTSPTYNPTKFPTVEPTGTPTQNPTSTSPTTSPTFNPTKFPTVEQTGTPTQNPTSTSPTTSPTYNPTKFPTLSPTYNPTKFPTTAPIT